jgi:hypothetical protein
VSPPVLRTSVRSARLEGRIQYSGAPEYLPRSLVRRDDADVLFAYSTTILRNRESFPQLVPGFNPLALLGYPTDAAKVTVVARLDILRRSQRLPGYDAQASLRRFSTLYGAASPTDLEREVLRAVRDSIDAQLANDAANLEQQLGPARR